MPISQPRVEILALSAVSVGASSEFFSKDFVLAPGASGLAVTAVFDVPGAMQIQQRRLDGTFVNVGSATTVTANTLALVTFAYNLGEVRVVFNPTPTSGTVTGSIEAHYFGQGGYSP